MRKIILYLVFISICSISGCHMIGAGTHGSLKGYQFDATKTELEIAVLKVIADNKNIHREPEASQEYKDMYKESIKERNKKDPNVILDTNYVDYYNEEGYITIKIKTPNQENEYIIRFYGGQQEWKTAPTSEIFIAYAYDKYRKGGSETNETTDPVLFKQLIDVFETEFMNKVETELKLRYTVTKD